MVFNNPVLYIDEYGRNRSLMRDWKEHGYLQVDTYDEKGNVNGQVDLHIDIINGFSVGNASNDGTVINTKCTSQVEDESLVSVWDTIIENTSKFDQRMAYILNNCWVLSLRYHLNW